MSAAGHARPRTVLLDVVDPTLADALATAFAPHRVVRVDVASGPAAVAAVVDGAADVVVCAPAAATEDPDDLHAAIALRAGWWATAVDVVGATLVLASSDRVVAAPPAPASGAGSAPEASSGADPDPVLPDEFEPPRPTTVPGRAWRAAEVLVRDAGGAVVRSGVDDDPVAVAATLHWAATIGRSATWHHPATATLDSRHTRLERADTRHVRDPGRG